MRLEVIFAEGQHNRMQKVILAHSQLSCWLAKTKVTNKEKNQKVELKSTLAIVAVDAVRCRCSGSAPPEAAAIDGLGRVAPNP